MSVLPGRAFAAGDMQYDGSNWSCWEDSWGEENLRMHPSTGNHEDAASFMDYWSTRGMWRHDSVGTLDGGYYFDVGGVRVFSLNSQWNIAATAQFLRNHSDDRLCEIAIWHHPYVSDGELGQLPPSDPRYADVTKVRPPTTQASTSSSTATTTTTSASRSWIGRATSPDPVCGVCGKSSSGPAGAT
jgi:hypothetical protein